jgi:hypothetical protein
MLMPSLNKPPGCIKKMEKTPKTVMDSESIEYIGMDSRTNHRFIPGSVRCFSIFFTLREDRRAPDPALPRVAVNYYGFTLLRGDDRRDGHFSITGTNDGTYHAFLECHHDVTSLRRDSGYFMPDLERNPPIHTS